jgi:hypothetical protein
MAQENIIDVEVLRNHLPEGEYFVQVNQDSFDEDIFECYLEEEDKEGWTEILLAGNNPPDPYCVQGQVIFVKQGELGVDIRYTSDTAVKLSEDVSLLQTAGAGLFIEDGDEEMLCIGRKR